ncbi:MAG: phosphatidylserine decarboxylase family protein [Balneolaceae bacterium]|nr:phosphatidylserine decarboxylase family protein [Balneolaceae bacterium]MBO6547471.1 phosphatidylserine decarboxylase family protein [Balneolaceae bacterium]MBO6647582.1 phosphatidylserine decarboxylase family protein [Balneolaceae bacterium]
MFAREGYPTMTLATIVLIGVVYLTFNFLPEWLAYILSASVAVLWGIVIYFFRDPERETPQGENLIISPADGKVVLIKEIEEDVYLKTKATQISIFLSPLNVHVNRNPISGKLEYLKYHPGKYLMAWDENASIENERADFGVLHGSGTKLFFKQITGFLARRIVYHIKEGDDLVAGDRFGMMKFGSRMDVIIPGNVDIQVKEGDRTWAGQSILGQIN